ncbi:PAS domain S-box protein [Lacinutrix sp. MedPE-SW]|uniref:PAS domain S-box protein n=1 Tax=Lacinutrix sp. MedPE-SW TaxID=1860087 RepID=UPI000910C625|nr:PAS domain S-box protein [Lacinutrix sp. MedPE-SW]OIQ16994.1 MAG: hypothetical protein BM549_13060 [Lacinutrix sp. MedPE-SW]
MDSLKKKIRRRYILFASVSITLFSLLFFVVHRHITIQKDDAYIINRAGKQRMLSQNITKQVLAYNNAFNSLKSKNSDSVLVNNLITEFKDSHVYLINYYKKLKHNEKLDSLFNIADKNLKKVTTSSKLILNTTDKAFISLEAEKLIEAEEKFLEIMDAIVLEYQYVAEKNLKKLQNNFYNLMTVSILLLALGFFYLLIPTIRELITKNEALILSNKALKNTKEEIKNNLKELKLLKENLEQKEHYNKIFIEQAPPSIAMLDKNMKYIAVSKKWKIDYKLEDCDVIGKSHYDIFPEIGDGWKQKHKECLSGAVDICDEYLFERVDGTKQWIFWEVKPWYINEGEIGGLIMYTGDITHIKEQVRAKARVEEILDRTTNVAKIGTWELDYKTKKYTLNKITREILNIPEDRTIYGQESLELYKEGESRNKILDAVDALVNTKKPFDIEVEMTTLDGNPIWVRDIGQAEFNGGECIRLFGIFQDISHIKRAEIELKRKNELLNFAEKITMMGHWQWHINTNKVTWSSNLYSIMGVDEDKNDITINTILNITHPEDVENVKLHMEKSFSEKRFHGELIHRVILKDGTIKTLLVLGKFILNDNDEVIEIIGSIQDISNQRMEEVKFKSLLESAPDAMIILNEDKKIHLINKQAERLFGYSQLELIDKPIDQLVPKRILEKFKEYRDNYFNDPQTLGMGDNRELIGVNKNGDEFPVQVSLSPLETESGLLVSLAIRDITKQKQVEYNIRSSKENLELLAKKLKTQNIQLADFAHITSHNLRAPVSNLNSLIDMYFMCDKEEDKQDVFKKFQKVITHLTETLNILVNALKIKKEKASLNPVRFSETLNKTKELLAAQIIVTGAEITSDFTEINKISYNKIYFESIFLNLVENAIKYRAKDRAPKIHLRTKLVDNHIVLEIEDNGLGINLDRHKHKIFGLNKVFHRHPEAKGVGLFMTKLQIESLGGKITVESTVDKGSKFIINFNK